MQHRSNVHVKCKKRKGIVTSLYTERNCSLLYNAANGWNCYINCNVNRIYWCLTLVNHNRFGRIFLHYLSMAFDVFEIPKAEKVAWLCIWPDPCCYVAIDFASINLNDSLYAPINDRFNPYCHNKMQKHLKNLWAAKGVAIQQWL